MDGSPMLFSTPSMTQLCDKGESMHQRATSARQYQEREHGRPGPKDLDRERIRDTAKVTSKIMLQ